VALEHEQRRVERARNHVGESLDTLERRFAPGHLASVGYSLARQSAARHPVAWAVGAAVGLAAVAGLVTWALISDDAD
jgi:hypothetical protein